jgi:hypothetical protein
MCTIEKADFFERLNNDLFTCVDNKERITLRNEILKETIPIIEHTVSRFCAKFNSWIFDDDMFQYLVERALLTIIPEWKPVNKSIEGYYKRCYYRAGINYLREKRYREDVEVSADPKDTDYWESLGTIENIVPILEDVFILPEGMSTEAYNAVKDNLRLGYSKNGRKGLIAELKNEYGFGKIVARGIYDQALVSCREMHGESIKLNKQEIDKSSLFGRMVKYLEEEQVEQIIKIFGGIYIKVPEWKDK